MNDQPEGLNLAEKYEKYYVPSIMDQWAKDLTRLVEPGDKVLDVACGTGVVSRHAAALTGNDGKVVGLDISQDMLEVAQSVPAPAGGVIDWREADAASIPFGDATFDVVLCQFGLMFMSEKIAVLKEMKRVLKSNGRLGVSVWVGGLYDQTLEEALTKHIDPDQINFLIWDYGNPGWLRSQVEQAGLKIVNLNKETKPSRYESIRKSVELMVDWSLELGELSEESLEQVISDMEVKLADYVNQDGFSIPESANIAVATAP
jgi:ubiquinone/menaquinone biosynthesis C-methylase UbiE